MNCDQSNGDGCVSCVASLFRPARRTEPVRNCPGEEGSDTPEVGQPCSFRSSNSGDRFPMVLLTLVAFVLPLVVIVAVVQCLESHVGSALAAIAGVVAAGLAAVISVGIVKLLAGRWAIKGAGR